MKAFHSLLGVWRRRAGLAYMVVTGRERIRAGLIIAACAVLVYWFIFDWATQSAWPPALLGDWFPDLRSRFGWF